MNSYKYDYKFMKSTEEELNTIKQVFPTITVNEDNIFIFPIVLCDNQVDDDYEAFTNQSLIELAKLFVGKTGIFDNSNVSARIYSCEVIYSTVQGSNPNSSDSLLHYILAKAYMIKTKDSEDIINEISSGIKSKVSISCGISYKTCSICCAPILPATDRCYCCGYKKGDKVPTVNKNDKEYTEVCFHLLHEPTDAYEWSFVQSPTLNENTISTNPNKVIKHNHYYKTDILKDIKDELNEINNRLFKIEELINSISKED